MAEVRVSPLLRIDYELSSDMLYRHLEADRWIVGDATPAWPPGGRLTAKTIAYHMLLDIIPGTRDGGSGWVEVDLDRCPHTAARCRQAAEALVAHLDARLPLTAVPKSETWSNPTFLPPASVVAALQGQPDEPAPATQVTLPAGWKATEEGNTWLSYDDVDVLWIGLGGDLWLEINVGPASSPCWTASAIRRTAEEHWRKIHAEYVRGWAVRSWGLPHPPCVVGVGDDGDDALLCGDDGIDVEWEFDDNLLEQPCLCCNNPVREDGAGKLYHVLPLPTLSETEEE